MADKNYYINLILCDFASMGANDEQLIEERQKLINDDTYLYKWLDDLGHTSGSNDVIH